MPNEKKKKQVCQYVRTKPQNHGLGSDGCVLFRVRLEINLPSSFIHSILRILFEEASSLRDAIPKLSQ